MGGFLNAIGHAVSSAKTSVVQACQARAHPLPTPVAPTIAIDAPKIVLVKKAHQAEGHRLRVKIGTTGTFTGTGALTGDAKVRLYDTAGTLIPWPYAAIPGADLTSGITLFVEAATPSAALQDVTLTLTLTAGAEPLIANPATDTLTCVELTLDLCVYKPLPGGGDPAPMAGTTRVTTGRNIHLQSDELYAGRAMIIVHQAVPAAYAGSVVLRALTDRLSVFQYAEEVPAAGQAAQGLPLSTANAVIPATGLKLWVEGSKASSALLDTGFRLEISDLPRTEGDKALLTVVKCRLDIGRSRLKPDKDPTLMTKAKTLDPGRFVHLQDALNQFGRARAAVSRAVPAAFVSQMELVVVDAATGLPAAPKLTVYSAETAGAAQPNPKTFNQTGAYPPANGTVDLWVQGTTVSGLIRDTELRLRVSDAEGYADKALFTVASFTQIQATIKPTPANTPRPGVPAPVNHVFTVNSLDPDFAVNLPLVLMKRAQPDIALVLTAAPANLPILWEVVRNVLDHKDIGGKSDVPTVTAAANVYNATLDTDARGSFRVRPYLDNNEDEKYSDGEPSIPLNLVLARVHIVRDNSAGIRSNLTAVGAAGSVNIRNGTWPASWAACTAAGGAGMTMEIVADVIGGGADGQLGLDKVFGGLVNMLTGNEIRLTYVDTTPVAPLPPVTLQVSNRYTTNRASATGVYNGTPMFQPGDPAPALLAFPVLDTGRNPGGLGGETAVMGRSGTWDLSVNRTVGQRRTLRCIDSPGRGFLSAHPTNPNALLANIHYVQRFRAHFCFWTNVSTSRGNTNDVAERVYSVKLLMDWAALGDWDVNSTGAVPVLTVRNRHKIKVSGRRTLKPIGRAQDNGVEVRPPSGITQAISWETT
jgi:hypothetical protein